MFRNNTAPVAEPAPVEFDSPPSEPVALSVLALDLDAPAIGWAAYLKGRGIEVITDDLGRRAIARAAARQLFDERRENEARQARRRRLLEAKAVSDDQLRRAQIWQGVPAAALPEGVSAASAMLSAVHDALPRRRSPVEEALSNSGTLTYHALQAAPEDES